MPHFKMKLFLAATLFGASFASPVSAQQQRQDGLWQTRCAGPSRNLEALVCEATQSIRVKESGQLLFKVDIVFPAQKEAPILQMQAPLGFYLPGKVKLAVDGTALGELDVGTCDQRGCFLNIEATPEMIDAMKAGANLEIDFAPSAERRQKINVPLTGFTRAMEAIQ
ncbi:Invasion associated locus B (IalB) protein [Labrenzia sp. THAF82]|nr:Invasion associated locus B (IalB) protein [Labrenzia sp. THAF82]